MKFLLLHFLIYFLSLMTLISSNTTTNYTEEKNLTNDEIDKFMACQELTNMIYLEDSPLIDGNFSHRNDTQKIQGIRSMLFMTMIQNCYNNINDTLVHLLYRNLTRDAKIEEIDDEEIAYIRANYTKFGQMESFELKNEFNKFIVRYNRATRIFKRANTTPEEIEQQKKKKEERAKKLKEYREKMKERKMNKTQTNETDDTDEEDFMKLLKENIKEKVYTFDLNTNTFEEVKEERENDKKKKEEDKEKKNEEL